MVGLARYSSFLVGLVRKQALRIVIQVLHTLASANVAAAHRLLFVFFHAAVMVSITMSLDT